MSKLKVTNMKKTLIRNPEQPVPKMVAFAPPSGGSTSSKVVENQKKKLSENRAAGKTRFDVPEMNSTLKISKQIDEVVGKSHPEKPKSDKIKLAQEERISRKVNFPYNQPVFKDLIPLVNNEVKTEPLALIRGAPSSYHKDKEPDLADFLEPIKPKVYFHMPTNSLACLEHHTSASPADSLRLYKLLQVNE